MDDVIKEMFRLLDKLDIQVFYRPFHKRAFYHPWGNNIIVSTTTNKTELDRTNALLHEVGHVALQLNEMQLYKYSKIAARKMEHEANVYRINKLVSAYANQFGIDHEVNIHTFMNANEIESWQEDDVREAFLEEHKKYKVNRHLG